MKPKVVVNEDFSLYYRGTFARLGEKVVQITDSEQSTQRGVCVTNSERIVAKVNDVDFSQPVFGYKQVGETVVYTSRRPSRTAKKGVTSDVISLWYPQQEEYKIMQKSLPHFDNMDIFSVYNTHFEDLDKELETKFAVVVTKFFAVVKKATHEYPVLYYRDIQVAEYLGNGEFNPIHGNECIIEKFKEEYSDVWNRD